mmetsp:Transcript_98133/g.210474  ORF Transcript_98133/g.210474 Transcript_98133/m.210474 type:complete len:289 (-) Transcript_98133:85-951(-)
MVAFRPALALVLLAGTWWASSAFIPSVFRRAGPGAGNAAALRGTPDGARGQEEGTSLLAMAPLGIAFLGLATTKRQQRSPVVSRRFFGTPEPAPPKKAESYKDYQDPWLGSADLGFDPLNVAVGSVFDKGTAVVPETTYYNYRESEVKHGRFAMAAFLAIFFEEADRGALLKQLGVAGATDNLDATLGLDEVQAPVLLVGLGAQALAEYSKQSKEDDGSFLSVEFNRDRCPGDLGFDPLALGAGNSKAQTVELHNIEVNLGRLAMIGVTAFLFKEFIVKDSAIASKIL